MNSNEAYDEHMDCPTSTISFMHEKEAAENSTLRETNDKSWAVWGMRKDDWVTGSCKARRVSELPRVASRSSVANISFVMTQTGLAYGCAHINYYRLMPKICFQKKHRFNAMLFNGTCSSKTCLTWFSWLSRNPHMFIIC